MMEWKFFCGTKETERDKKKGVNEHVILKMGIRVNEKRVYRKETFDDFMDTCSCSHGHQEKLYTFMPIDTILMRAHTHRAA